MATKKQKNAATAEPTCKADEIAAELAALGITDFVKLAENLVDGDVTCISSGFPQLDVLLHSTRKGLPMGRDIEIYSREPEVGKTSLALQLLKNWQDAGKVCAIVDVENTITVEFLHDLGILTKKDPERPNIVPVYIAGHGEMLSAEEVLDLVYKISNSPKFDLVVVDSVAGLESRSTLDKDLDEAEVMGGIAKMLGRFCRKNKNKHATVIWINQMRMAGLGQFNPSGQVKYSTSGGRALPFFCSIRLELSMIEKIKHPSNPDECIGIKTKIYSAKNKISPPFRSTILTYIFGDGFSSIYDYIDIGLKAGAITKSGSWFMLGGQKWQGLIKMYEALKTDAELFSKLKWMVDGEDVVEEEAAPAEQPEDFSLDEAA